MHVLRDRRLLLWVSLGALALSVAGKLLADIFIADRIALLGDAVGLVHTLNPGIAFGLRFPPIIQTLLIAAALALVVWAALKERRTTLVQVGFGLIIGGALGNLADRAGDGFVTDLFQVGAFPVFNVADSCITIGAALLLLSSIRRP